MAKKARLGSGKRFKKLSGSVAAQYEKKGMSPKKAEALGNAVAAKSGRKRYGTKKMTKMAVAGKRRENADKNKDTAISNYMNGKS